MPPTLDQWSIAPVGLGPYQDPCLAKALACHGIVSGHPDFEDGTEILTSYVQEMDSREGVLRTASRVYKLGDMSPKYKRWRARRECEEHVVFKKAC